MPNLWETEGFKMQEGERQGQNTEETATTSRRPGSPGSSGLLAAVVSLIAAACIITPSGVMGDSGGAPASPADEGSSASEGKDKLSIRSEHLVVDTKTGTASFKGDVIVRHEKMVLKCEQLEAEYDQQGNPGAMTATGSVRLSSGEIFAKASRATYRQGQGKSGAAGSVTLSGAPKVWRGSYKLEGSTIEIDLTSGKVEVKSPKGVWSWADSKRP